MQLDQLQPHCNNEKTDKNNSKRQRS